MNVVDYFFEHSKDLDTEFLVGTTESVSHHDLYVCVHSLASHIRTRFGTGKKIVLLSENNLFFIQSYLSIILSGNIVVLVETRISDRDLDDVLEQCQSPCVFVQGKYESRFKQCECIITEATVEAYPRIRDEYPPDIPEDNPAVIIFTSGSTGTKKGVMLSHKNIIANTASIIQYLDLTQNDRMYVVLPFFYCYGASLLHTHLRVGGSICISNSIFLGSALTDLNTYHCTGFAGVPSTYQILINKTPFLKTSFPHLRYFTQAGGQLANAYISMITEAFPDVSFCVMYGATEATARLSYLPPHLVKEKMGSIGKGIPGVRLEVLDPEGMPILPHQTGEITAMGDNIMKGYYNDPEETRNKIRNGRLFTGDLATIDDEGYIYIVGRASNIIKSAGYRISPVEIENIISTVEGVGGCVIFGMPDSIMGEAVVAVIQSKEKDRKNLQGTILSKCNQCLPSYKIPKHMVVVKEFPRNSSYKVDHHILKELVRKQIEEKQ